MSAENRVSTYANAFYEAAMERWLATLGSVASKLENSPELRDRLEATDADIGDRQALLSPLLPTDADPLVRNFLYTLIQRGDLALLPDTIEALRHRMFAGESRPVLVEVMSAVPLAEDERQKLQARLEREHGTALDMAYSVDPAILGGLIVRIGDKLIDGSVASRLAKLRQALGVTAPE